MHVRAAFLLLLAVCVAGDARGQQPILVPPAGPSSQFALIPETLPGSVSLPLFAESGVSGTPAVTGTANGLAVNTGTGIAIGFDYVRPFWTFRDFTLAVPAANASSFPILGDTGHVDNHFAVAPRLDLRYRFPDSALGVGASGSFLSLTGHLQRDVTSPAGIGQLAATSSLTLVVANLVEITRRVECVDLFKKDDCPACLEDLVLDLSIGSRYSSLAQNYTDSLSNATGPVNITTRASTQAFQGFGVTSSVNVGLPLGADWLLFTKGRGSVLVGDNVRRSTLTVDIADQAGSPNVIDEDKTVFIPVGELEMGVVWGNLFAEHFRANDRQLSFAMKVSAVAQYWGSVGPLSAGSSQAFRTSDLFLVGAGVMVGLQY